MTLGSYQVHIIISNISSDIVKSPTLSLLFTEAGKGFPADNLAEFSIFPRHLKERANVGDQVKMYWT